MQMLTSDEEALINQLQIGAVFRHYSGKKYKILQIARHSEDKELYVVYQGLYHCEKFGNFPIWIRPMKMFLERIDKKTPRFMREN